MKIITKADFLNEKNNPKNFNQNRTVREQVEQIIFTVREHGDKALFRYTEQLDGAKLDTLLVNQDELAEARNAVEGSFIHALNAAKRNITSFHEQQKQDSWYIDDQEGVYLGQKITPLDRVGVYVPGGKAAYPSTVLMIAITGKL